MKTVGGLLLAAGRSSRMINGYHKLLAEFDGVPLVRKSAETMLRSEVASVTVVTGHRCSEIEVALHGLPLAVAYNKDFAHGMGTSLACGFKHESLTSCDGILIMLADMPEITTDHINQLLAPFQSRDAMVVRGTDGKKPGHPVIVPAVLFADMRKLDGDQGAKDVIQRQKIPIQMIDLGSAALKDVDTAEDLAFAGGTLCRRGSVPG
ncbi:nucleotidyltransferase family protein [Agrobacterium tumefaciens]|uniref:nucleotidyltransferase family protein n=1 Tax=Agrobacterium tumefaciens TaxID=358 RepID=UPI00023A3170|nr:hypothetical protein AT5A_25105 [Agrobacterium tumefaciens 5A]